MFCTQAVGAARIETPLPVLSVYCLSHGRPLVEERFTRQSYGAALYAGLKELPGVRFTQKVESNQLFLTMPRPVIDNLLKDYFFYFWNEEENEIRFVTSFDTTEQDIEELLRAIRRYCH